jgi:hypothetical protein
VIQRAKIATRWGGGTSLSVAMTGSGVVSYEQPGPPPSGDVVNALGTSLWCWAWAGDGSTDYVTLELYNGLQRIVQMNDLSGNGRHYTGTIDGSSTGAPFYQEGLTQVGDWGTYETALAPVMRDKMNDGSDLFGQSMSQSARMETTGPFYLAFAGFNRRSAGHRWMWGFSDSSYSNTDYVRLDQGNDRLNMTVAGSAEFRVSPTGSIPKGPIFIEIWRDESNNIYCRCNGQDVTNPLTTEGKSGNFRMTGIGGGGSAGSGRWDDYSFEYIVCNDLPNEFQRNSLRGIIGSRWSFDAGYVAPDIPYQVGIEYGVSLQNYSASTQTDVPITFGLPIQDGDLPQNMTFVGELDGQPIDVQVNRRALQPDGQSWKHVVCSVILPTINGSATRTLMLNASATGLGGTDVSLTEMRNANQEVRIDLDFGGGTVYRALLSEAVAQAPLLTWFTGPVASEWVFSIPFKRVSDSANHAALTARFYVRKYAGLNNMKVDFVVENANTFTGTRTTYEYMPEVWINGTKVWDYTASLVGSDWTIFQHIRNRRWKYTCWTGYPSLIGQNRFSEPPINVQYDQAMLWWSKAFPRYREYIIGHALSSTGAELVDVTVHSGSNYDGWGPMGKGDGSHSTSPTGISSVIGPFTEQQIRWLMGQEQNAKYRALRGSDLAASHVPCYRDENTGQWVRIDPAWGGYLDWPESPSKVATSGSGGYIGNDTAHAPQLSFVPYLITGDFFHWEQLDCWMEDMFEQQHYYRYYPAELPATTYAVGDRRDGVVYQGGQQRSKAWTLRTLVMTAMICPDDYYVKDYFLQKLDNNISYMVHADIPRNNWGQVPRPGQSTNNVKAWQDGMIEFVGGYCVYNGFRRLLDEGWLAWKLRFATYRWGFPLTVIEGSDAGQAMRWSFMAGVQNDWPCPADANGDYFQSINAFWDHYVTGEGGFLGGSVNDVTRKYAGDPTLLEPYSQAIADIFDVPGPGHIRGDAHSSHGFVSQAALSLAPAGDFAVGGMDAFRVAVGDIGHPAADPPVFRQVFPETTRTFVTGNHYYGVVPYTYTGNYAGENKP